MRNIATFGDTDIFPFSFEQHVLHDRPDLLQVALEQLHADFDAQLANPPDNINTLVPVGYTGFRWATQIDPLWNAYYLALVIEIALRLSRPESPRPKSPSFPTVLSSQTLTGGSLTRISTGGRSWKRVMESRKRKRIAVGKAGRKDVTDDAKESPYVILCDISDFYSRIYHHRVENALKWLNAKADVVKRIVEILGVFSGTVSYGLPLVDRLRDFSRSFL